MKYIFDIWEKISTDIKTVEHILLVLDYDGTLIPIKDSPELAILDEDIRSKVRDLAGHPFFSIGIISGRSLADAKKGVAINNIYYSGNQGLECESPQIKFIAQDAKELIPLIQLVEEELIRELGHIKGILVENKGLTLSVHYRKVKLQKVRMVKDIFNRTLQPLVKEERIRIRFGKKILEICPPLDLDKGKALRWMIRNVSFAHSKILPIYIGDDEEDNSAFEEINKRNGLSVFVGKNNSNSYANYFLKSQKEIKKFLERIKNIVDINKLKPK